MSSTDPVEMNSDTSAANTPMSKNPTGSSTRAPCLS